MHFMRVISHSLGAHTVNEDIDDTDDDDGEGDQPSTADGTAAVADDDCTRRQSDNC